MVALQIALTLGCVAIGGWTVGGAVYTGLRTGRLPHTDSRSVVVRKTHPVRFWALMALFLAMLGLLGYGAVLGIQRALA